MNRDPIVFIVEDDKMTCKSLQALLKGCGHRIEAFSSAEEFLSAVQPQQVGCVVTDFRLGGISGLELQGRLRELETFLSVVVISGYASVAVAVQAMSEGAVTVLEKPFEPSNLISAVETALARSAKLLSKRERMAVISRLFATLTQDEAEVLDMMVKGRANAEIATALHISPRTCDRRRSSVQKKMGVESLPELAALVAEFRLLQERGP